MVYQDSQEQHKEKEQKVTDSPIFFWTMKEFESFSNFFPSVLVIDGVVWPTVEHYFQAHKSLDTQEREMVRLAGTPAQSKKLGRSLQLRADWEEVKYEIMLKALRTKFSDRGLKEILLSTADRTIYEDSPYDRIWGTGELGGIGTGKNLLGKALMQVRNELRGV